MNTALAERLLCSILEWTEEEVKNERPLLQAISSFKYDEYQQFSPGKRFIESLVGWLKQFDNLNDKRIAYQFIIKQLIFFSNDQVSHLVNISYSAKVKPILLKKTSIGLEVSSYAIKTVVTSELYKQNKRRALYLGLSDGAKIDLFRRSSGISNEQVYPTYQISADKAEDIQGELESDTKGSKTFNTLFLIDDFTASGKSYWRANEGKGKILKLFKSIFNDGEEVEKNHVSSLIDTTNISIHILFYIATQSGRNYIDNEIAKWKEKNNLKFDYSVDVVQLIDNDVKESVLGNSDFIKLIEKYYDDSIEDKHYKKGFENGVSKGPNDKPFLGFNECSLPLILNHNTPNNSLPILWFPEDKKYVGLFPRVTRHKE